MIHTLIDFLNAAILILVFVLILILLNKIEIV